MMVTSNDTPDQMHQNFIVHHGNLKLEFIIHDSQWQEFYQDNIELLKNVGFAAFDAGNLQNDSNRIHQINIILCNDDFIHTLNYDHRQMDKPTNVLSFPSYDCSELELKAYMFGDFQIFGDVFIAYEYCNNEAKSCKKSLKNHIAHMITHGILHILGYDHINDYDAISMENKEIAILENFNIENPYQDI